MTRIRPLRQEDLPQVVSLYRSYLAWPLVADEHDLVASFERIFVDAPFTDPEIPSLVWADGGGEVVGFLGSLVHPMRFDGRPMRLACSSSLVVAPQARKGGVGALLLRKYLAGPQDLTITDTAEAATEQLWKRLGGSSLPLASIVWLVPLAPLRMVVGVALWRSGWHRVLPLVRPLCAPVDAVFARLPRSIAGREPDDLDDLYEVALSPDLLIEHLRLGPGDVRMWRDHDTASLARQFDEMGGARSKGRLVRNAVYCRGGTPVGWYVAYLRPNDVFEIVHAERSAGNETLLVSHMLRKARDLKASAVQGRLEPWLLESLPRRAVMLSHVKFLYHSRSEPVRDAVRAGEALVTGLEGDMWMPR